MFSLLFLTLSAHAGVYSNGTFSSGGDEGTREILGESVNNHSTYASCPVYGGNLSATTGEVVAFINQMGAIGYTNYRHYYDATAWSSDLEQAGGDATYADAADFFYVSTHGNTGRAYFCGSSGDQLLYANETKWGDGDVEVGIFSSCYTLDSTGRSSFGAANLNGGAHYIMGFQSVALDTTTTGDKYGYYLANNYYIDYAWDDAVDDGHGSGYTSADVRFYNSSCNTYLDKALTVSCDPKSGSSWVGATWATY